MHIRQVSRVDFNMQVFLHYYHEVDIIQAIQVQCRFQIGGRNNPGTLHFKFFLKKIIDNLNNLVWLSTFYHAHSPWVKITIFCLNGFFISSGSDFGKLPICGTRNSRTITTSL